MKLHPHIPIFPLSLVLFPGATLPLHIFEPRYKLMIRRCLSEHLPFGVILASSKGIALVGTTAEIVQTIKEYPDGRMDILTMGQSVFSVKELIDTKEYYEAVVEYPADSPQAQSPLPAAAPPQSNDPLLQAELVAQFNRCHILLFGRPWSSPQESEDFPLSFTLAALLPLDLVVQQRLLELRGERVRRDYLLECISRLLPEIAERQRIRRSVGGNGHPVN
ncbi:MAG TPA: LON peptidase substrate-binding domain-containing protein [Verrucomicrobiae bacterium]|nr:LON peptidase substrate-binding domain-containing protein [Verrucomicrobiae bacterium]